MITHLRNAVGCLPIALTMAAAGSPQSLSDAPAREPIVLLADPAPEARLPRRAASVPRARAVSVAPSAAARLTGGAAHAGPIVLDAFGGRRLRLDTTSARTTRTGATLLRGIVDGDGRSSFTIATDGRTVAGYFRPADGPPLLLRGGPDGPWLGELSTAALPPCGVTPERLAELGARATATAGPGASPADSGAPTGALGTAEFDVLVLYTDAVSDLAGGPVALALELEVAIAEGTAALGDSDVAATLELVGALPVDYSEAVGTHTDHLFALSNPTDGVIDEIHEWREAAGADLVSLIVDDTDGGTLAGLGYILPPFPFPFIPLTGPFNTVDYGALGDFELIHQLGHNMGCAHDYPNAGVNVPDVGVGQLPWPANQDAFGWRWTGQSGTEYRSIMALAPGQRVGRFSNPDLDFDGVPTGKAGGVFLDPGADNARSLGLLLGTISGLATPPPPASVVYVDLGPLLGVEDGTQTAPYDSLEEALLRVSDGGRVLARGTTMRTPPILGPVVVERWTAPATLLD